MKKSFPILLSLFTLLLLPFRVFAVDLTTIQEKVSDYLPYILIGGAVILLISIIGILLGKKKEKDTSSAPVEMAQPITPQPTEEVKAPIMEDTNEAAPTVNMDTISNNLYSPTPEATPERPPIQETLGATPQPVPEDSNQSSDLQAILQQESSSSPMAPVTDQAFASKPTTTPATPVPPLDTTTSTAPTMDNTLSAMPEPSPVPPIETTTNTVPDLQQFVNNQVAEVPPMATPVTEPTPAPTDTVAPTQTGTPISI